MKCTKAIIPVAGFGTRRLPVTKAVEKCMLPVLNRPVIDYIVADCIAAGITEFFFVVGEDCRQLKQYYQRNQALEKHLVAHHKQRLLELIQPPQGCQFHFIEQTAHLPYGTSVPVWLCRNIVGADEQVLVIMGDQFLFNADGSSETAHFLHEAAQAAAPSAMLGVSVPKAEVHKYGIVSTQKRGNSDYFQYIIEKPTPELAPSNLMNASSYLFDKDFFAFVAEDMEHTREGEYLITDPLNTYVEAGHDIAVIRNHGEYLDCGTVEGWLHANQRVWRLSQVG
jgi:UTP--glucose-1-phosphate uridylyltransferase